MTAGNEDAGCPPQFRAWPLPKSEAPKPREFLGTPTTWLEWALHRLSHLLYIHDHPNSVEAGFGPGETMAGLREDLPKMRKVLEQAQAQEKEKG